MRKTLLLIVWIAFTGMNALAQVGPPPLCWSPVNLTASNVTAVGATFSWTEVGGATSWEILILPAGTPLPVDQSLASAVSNTPVFTFTGLSCNTTYDFYVRVELATCTSIAPWSQALSFTTVGCPGGGSPQNLINCVSGGESCFDLTVNDVPILGILDPAQYTVSYYTDYNSAFDGSGTPLTDPVCLMPPMQQIIFARVANNSGDVLVTAFELITQSAECPRMILEAFLDSNANGVQDNGEPPFLFGNFEFRRNNGPLQAAGGNTGSFVLYDSSPANVYHLGYAIDPEYASYYTVTPAQLNNVNPPVSDFSVYTFAVVPTGAFEDVSISLASSEPPRPGFARVMYLSVTNHGMVSASGTITFDNLNGFPIDAVSVPTTVTPTGFTAAFSDLAPQQTQSILVHTTVPVIPEVQLGDLVVYSASVASADDVIPSNDVASLYEVVVGSYDPNDKMEAHGPEIDSNDFTAGDYLTYTIRFENTGTAAANTVLITDTLDAQLLANSARLVASSHNCTMERNEQHLSWRFNNIMLEPVSETNALQGHGFVTFEVKTGPGVGLGDLIQNNASIYFDFNPAIVTNTFETRIVETLGLPSYDMADVALYPNPTSGVLRIALPNEQKVNLQLYDRGGKQLLLREKVCNGQSIDVGALPVGLYFVKITGQDFQTTKKLLRK